MSLSKLILLTIPYINIPYVSAFLKHPTELYLFSFDTFDMFTKL